MVLLFDLDIPSDNYISDDEDEEDPDDRYPSKKRSFLPRVMF